VIPDSDRRGPRRVFLDATGTYLRTILELEEEHGLPPKRPWLRARLDISRSAVNQQLRYLSSEGLVEVSDDHRVVLTTPGRRVAARVMRKHRLAERLLVDVIGLDWELAHDEATRWQHVLGDDVERRLLGILDAPWSSPYGNPVPALEELVEGECGAPPQPQAVRCDHFARAGGGRAVVHLVGEGVQADGELLHRLFAAGVRPGAGVDVRRTETGEVRVDTDAGAVELDVPAAHSVLLVAAAADRDPGALAGVFPWPGAGD
jgi:DtxR family transcriptional regulator, Mn-dependent transcriptional regulator